MAGRTLGGMTGTGERRAAGPLWWGRPRSAVLDVSLAVVSAAECGQRGAGFAGEVGIPGWAGVLLGLVVGASLVLRARWPIAVVLVGIAVTPAEMGFLLGLVGLYTLAASHVPRRLTALLTVMQAVGAVIVMLFRMHQSVGSDPSFDPPVWFVPSVSVSMALALTAPPVLLGLYVGARRRLVESLRERADGLERELVLLAERAEERAEWARGEERTRIAREMHDVVAHRVSLMVVHAAALQRVALRDPEKASSGAALLGDMGRQALTELRTMLGVLRAQGEASAVAGSAPGRSGESGSASGSGSGSPAGSGSGSASVAASVPGPAGGVGEGHGGGFDGPRLAQLEALVGESRAVGMSVEFSVEGEPEGGYGPQVEGAAFRLVQEALTNVHKHAAGARTRVRLAHRDAEVAVQVENGPPVAGGAAGVADAGLPSGGNGLVGMRERVVALGGGFVSGPTDAGGFRVSAVIPAGRPGSAGGGRAAG